MAPRPHGLFLWFSDPKAPLKPPGSRATWTRQKKYQKTRRSKKSIKRWLSFYFSRRNRLRTKTPRGNFFIIWSAGGKQFDGEISCSTTTTTTTAWAIPRLRLRLSALLRCLLHAILPGPAPPSRGGKKWELKSRSLRPKPSHHRRRS